MNNSKIVKLNLSVNKLLAIFEQMCSLLWRPAFTKKCQTLACDVVMKVTNEKKGIFSFHSHNMNKEM